MYYINLELNQTINNIINKVISVNIKFIIIKYQEFLNFIIDINKLIIN